MAELAIKGHKTRGKEVIALLEMLGGKNESLIPYDGRDTDSYYRITDDGCIVSSRFCPNKNGVKYQTYTLEELEREFPYKVGDEVDCIMNGIGVCKIVCMSWMEDVDEVLYYVQRETEYGIDSKRVYVQYLRPYNPEPVDTSPDKSKAPSLEGQDYSEGRCGYKIPEGFEFDKVENGEIILKPKKKALPKTYEECCEVLGISRHDVEIDLPQPYQQNMFNLFKLLICRDAYWKLADDWSFKIGGNSQEVVYGITIWGTGIMKDFYHKLNCNLILVFPTEEMRDAFYENFYDLINVCKELL